MLNPSSALHLKVDMSVFAVVSTYCFSMLTSYNVEIYDRIKIGRFIFSGSWKNSSVYYSAVDLAG
jgi:hypothetical protein